MTIGYKVNGDFWASEYSYDTSCFARVNKNMLSFNEYITGTEYNTPGTLSWIHRDDSPKCLFYNQVQRPSVTITVNDNPSKNKVFKAMSFEGSTLDGTTATLIANQSSQGDQSHVALVRQVEEKGGIFYSSIGKRISSSPTNNLKVVGEIMRAYSYFNGGGDNVDITLQPVDVSGLAQTQAYGWLQVRPINGMFSFSVSNGTDDESKYLIGAKDADGNIRVVYARRRFNGQLYLPSDEVDGNTFWVTHGVNSKIWAFDETPAGMYEPVPSTGYPKRIRNYVSFYIKADEYGEFNSAANAAQAIFDINGTLQNNRLFLYEYTDPEIDGEDPKGQYADIQITFPTFDFELYAVNVDYVPTDLDHARG